MFRTGAQFMLLVLLVGLLLTRESQQPFAGGIDEAFADFLARNSRRQEPAAPITLVAINDNSLKGHPWPWTPLDFALFFQAANAFQPEAVATDEWLSWEERNLAPEQRQKLPQYEKILREHVLRAPKVLLGAKLGFPEDPQVIPPLQETTVIRHVTGDLNRIPEFTTIAEQAEEDFRLSAVSGFTNLPSQRRSIHSVPLLLRYRGQLVPSFVLQAILLWEKVTPDEVTVSVGERVTLAERLDIPIDARGEMRVDFGVLQGRCGFDELVLASAQTEAQRESIVATDLLNGKLLLLSRTDRAAQTVPLAASRNGSPGELLAAGIATIQNRSFLRRVPWWVDASIIGGAAIVALKAPRWKKSRVLLGSLLFVILYVMMAMSVFGKTLRWTPIFLPAGLALFIPLYRFATPSHEREL